MEKEEYKLKPCPICGSEVNLIEENVGEYTVVCHGCQVLMIADDVSSKNEAIERWNNRVNEPKWHNYKIESPTEERDYLVIVAADKNYGNADYIDVCQWNGEYFEGGKYTGVDDGLDITHWMPLPEPPKG